MSIAEIAKLQKQRGKTYECFSEISDKQYGIIQEALNNLLLIQVSEMEHSLEKWLTKTKESNWYKKQLEDMSEEDFDKNMVLKFQKVSTSSNDLSDLGHWYLRCYLTDMSKPNIKVRQTGDLEFSLNEALDSITTTEFNFKTNQQNSGTAKVFEVPINDFSKIYDFFLPEKCLKEYNAAKLSLELSDNRPTIRKANKL